MTDVIMPLFVVASFYYIGFYCIEWHTNKIFSPGVKMRKPETIVLLIAILFLMFFALFMYIGDCRQGW